MSDGKAGVERFIQPAQDATIDPATVEYLEVRRRALIMELRGIERVLIRAGKLARETLPVRA